MSTVVAAAVSAQEIGTAAEAEGTVELLRSGSRSPVSIGTAFNTGDEIQTGKPGRVVIVFDDDSVLVVGDSSHIRFERHDFQPDAALLQSRMQLSQGKVRALVSERYRASKAAYQIQTATALATAQGTEFVVAYDPVAEVTDVVGVGNTVRVQSLSDRAARGAVLVGPQELTSVAKSQLPVPPRYIPDARFRSYLDGLEFVGEGRPESLAARPVLAGNSVPPPEQADAFPVPFALREIPGDFPDSTRPHILDPEPDPKDPEVYYPAGGVDVKF